MTPGQHTSQVIPLKNHQQKKQGTGVALVVLEKETVGGFSSSVNPLGGLIILGLGPDKLVPVLGLYISGAQYPRKVPWKHIKLRTAPEEEFPNHGGLTGTESPLNGDGKKLSLI